MPGFSLKKALSLALRPQSSEHFCCLAGLRPLGTPGTYEVVIKHASSGKDFLLPKEKQTIKQISRYNTSHHRIIE